MYLTYEEYQNMGGVLDETAFTDLSYAAAAEIDWFTFDRLAKDTRFDDKVKRCMYLLIQLIYTKQMANALPTESGDSNTGVSAAIASQSNDGVSVSYNVRSASEIVQGYTQEIADCINKYLGSVRNEAGRKVLYRGVYPDE